MRYEFSNQYLKTTESKSIMKTSRLTKGNDQNENWKKLDELIRLQQFAIALELLKIGVTQQQMAKSLGVSKTTINNMLKGISIEK